MEKLGYLTELDTQSLFNLDNSDTRTIRDPKDNRQDRYTPKSLTELALEMKQAKVPKEIINETFGKWNSRRGKGYNRGFLTLGELYDFQRETLEFLNEEKPEILIERYMELYRESPVSNIEINAEIDRERSPKNFKEELPNPLSMSPKGDISSFEIADEPIRDDGRERNEISFHNFQRPDMEKPSRGLSIQINLDNPTLFPVQEHALELLGVKTKNSSD
jgi:hypothetical protein